MASLWVKICGLTAAAEVAAIARHDVSALGFICVPASPRYVSPAQMPPLVEACHGPGRSPLERVGVFANADGATLASYVDQDLFTTLQLHGQESPEFCQQVRTTYPHLRLMKAFRIRDAADLAAIAPYEAVVDRVLLDAYHPHVLGGTGQTLDWGALSAFRPRCPWVLAGGLTPDNVATALGQLTPDGIDLSSGVESAPGRKDLSQVARLFGAIAAATTAHPQEPSVGK